MTLRGWVGKVFENRQRLGDVVRERRAKRLRVRPWLEILEARLAPSTSPFFFNNFPTPTANSLPTGIATGPDGNLYFCETNAGQIGILNPTNGSIQEVNLRNTFPNAEPVQIVQGPDGQMWFSDFANDALGEINPANDGVVEYGTNSGNGAFGLPPSVLGITSFNGDLWFTDVSSQVVGVMNGTGPGKGQVLHLYDATSNGTAPLDTPFMITSGPEISAGFGGVSVNSGAPQDIYFTDFYFDSAIDVLNPATGAIARFSTPTPNARLVQVIEGPDGNVWFTESNTGNANGIDHIGVLNVQYSESQDSNSVPITEFAVNSVANSQPSGIVAYGTNNLWFTEGVVPVIGSGLGGNRIGEVTIGTANASNGQINATINDYPISTPNAGPSELTVGPDGNLWFGESAASPSAIGQAWFVPSNLGLNAPSQVSLGTPFNVTESAILPNSQPALGYAGTADFTSSDMSASLPAPYPFQLSDQAVHTFSLTLNTLGMQTVTVNDPLAGLSQSVNIDVTAPNMISWAVNASGDWNTPSNWSSGVVPGAGDTAIINPAVPVTVTMSAVGAVGGLQIGSNQTLLVTGGANFTIGGNVMNDGTIELQPNANGGVVVPFSGNVTLAGTGEMLMDPEVNGNYVITYPTSGSTVTNAAGHTIRSLGGGYFGAFDEGTVVNQGILEADGSGGGLTINSFSATNSGTWEATNGGGIEVGPNTSLDNSSGQIAVDGAGSNVYNFGTITGGPLTLTNGSFLLNGDGSYNGTITGSTLNLTGASILTGEGILNGITVPQGSDVNFVPGSSGNTQTLEGTVTDDGMIELTPSSSSIVYMPFSGNVTLAGTGEMLMDPEVNGNYVITYPTSGSTVTNAAGHTIRSLGGGYFGAFDEGTVVNQGILEADGSGGGLTINSFSATNSGTWEATNGGGIEVGPNTSLDNSSGQIAVDGAGSNVYNFGTITGGPLTLTNGSFLLNGDGSYNGTITGSTLNLTGASILTGEGILNGITVPQGSDVNFVPGSSGNTQTLEGTVTDDGMIELTPSSSSIVYMPFSGNVTLAGTGEMQMDAEVNSNYVVAYATSGSTVTNSAGHTILSIGGGNYFGGYQYGTVVNQGTLEADGGGLTVNSAASTNSGTWEALNGGGIEVGPSTSLDNSGGQITGDGGSTVYNFGTITGGSLTLTNGSTLLNGNNSYNGTITGSTLNLTGASILTGEGILNGITVPQGSDVNFVPGSSGNTQTLEGTVTDDGMIELTPSSSSIVYMPFSGNVTLAGTGEMQMDAEVNGNYVITYATSGSTVTNAAGHTILSIGGGNYFGGYQYGTVVNQGTLEADGGGLTVNSAASTNSGTWEALNGGGIEVGPSTSLDNSGGQITGDGGSTVYNFGTITGGSLTLTNGSTLLNGNNNYNGTITGGTLNLTGASILTGEGILNGITVPQGSDVNVIPGSSGNAQTLEGTVTDDGMIELTPSSSSIVYMPFSGNVTLEGTGEMLMDAEVNGNYVVAYATSGSTVTNAAGHTIRSIGGGNSFGAFQYGTVVNQGTLEADGGGLTVNSAASTNSGTWEALNGGGIEVGPNTSLDNSGGQITGDASSTVYNFGTITGGSLTLTNGSTLQSNGAISGGTLNFTGGSMLSGNGTLANVAIPVGADLIIQSNTGQSFTGTLTNGGTIELEPSTYYAYLNWIGGLVLEGTGQVLMDPGPYYSVLNSEDGSTLTIDSGQTIISNGGGYVGGHASGTVINDGLVEASGNQAYVDLFSGGAVNDGTIEAVQAGTVYVLTSLNNNSGVLDADAGTLSIASSCCTQPEVSGGTIDLIDGSILNNQMTITGSTLNLTGGSTLTGVGTLTDVVVAAGSLLSFAGATQQTFDGTLTNNGTISVQNSATLDGALDNTGSVIFYASTILGTSGDQHLNAGLIGIAPGVTVTVSGSSLTNELGGLITGGGVLNTSSVAFVSNGIVDLALPSVLDAEIQPSTLQITYVSSGGMNATTVTNPANYTIIGNSGSGNNVSGLISNITYDSTSAVATINFSQDLPDDIYQVSINGGGVDGVQDASGNALYSGGEVVVNRVLGVVPPLAFVALDPASDSGAPDHPGYTNVTTPTFDVQVNQAGTITMDFDGNPADDQTQSAPFAGTYYFTPTVALADGTYTATATFDSTTAGNTQATTSYTIDTVAPQVVSFAPTGTVNDSVSQATVTFSEPVDLNSFSPLAITLTGPSGTISVSQPQLVSGSTYAIPFLTQTADGAYTLTIASSVADYADNLLGQPYTASFSIALPQLQVANLAILSPASPESGNLVTVGWDDLNAGSGAAAGSWIDSVTVVNTSTSATLYTASVPYNSSQSGSIQPGGSAAQSFAFTLPNGAAGVGNIQVTVTVDANQGVSESNTTNGTGSTAFSSTLAAYPDLQVAGLALSPANAAAGLQSGASVTVSWDDVNNGDAAVQGAFFDTVLVQQVGMGGTMTTIADSSVPGDSSLAAGQSSPEDYVFSLPNGIPGTGTIQVTVTTNAFNTVPSYTSSGALETNNSATLTATSALAPYPQLQVTGLTVAPASGSAIQSGSQVVVSWNDSNTGNGAVSGNFTDSILVQMVNGDGSLTTVASGGVAGDSTLAAGAGSPEQFTFQLPNGAPGVGTFQVTVTTNAGNMIFELNTSNSSATTTFTSTLAAYPDLVPSDITAPGTLGPGQQITVGWTLSNQGDAAANGPWAEQVLLATDSAGDNPTLLGTFQYAGPLAVGQSVPRSVTVQVPNLAPGNYWLVVSENPFGQVFETDTANNTASQATSIPAALTLTLANPTVSDGAGANATTATVTTNENTGSPVVVTLDNSDPQEVSIPATVTIPAGQTSVTFAVGTINPDTVVGTQTATLTASATDLLSASGALTVTDVNVPTLTLVLGSQSISESAPNPATMATITRNTATTDPLVVSLVSSNINKLTVPVSVTIPAGQVSATFPVSVVDDGQIDGNEAATITAASSGFVSGSAIATVLDVNIPTLSLTLSATTVSESAQNPATTGTVSIASPAVTPITIVLTSSNTSAATTPATVVIDAGQTSATFPIDAVDDTSDTTNLTATIAAEVETNAGVILVQGSASASLLVLDAQGPALSLSFAASTVEEGAVTTGTVTTNTSTTNPLTVSLSCTDPTDVTIPATVTIPAGQSSASFSINAIGDDGAGGVEQVQITASASGLDTAIAPLNITNVKLPDLVLSSVTAPTSGYDNASATISWTVTNSGLYPAIGSWLDEVFLDPVGGPESANPADTVQFTGTVNAGQGYTQSATFQLPAIVAEYDVRVVTDASQSIQELSFSNNTGMSALPLDVQASYHATVTTNVTKVPNGTPIPLSGVATLTSTGGPAADVPVAVGILVDGTMRTLTAYTNSQGQYNITFEPLQDEAGDYSVTADDPGVTNPAVQLQFVIVGMSATPSSANVQVVPNTPLSGQFTLTDLSSESLTGITATASGGPAGVTVNLTPPSEIAGNGTAMLGYSLDATVAQAETGVVTIQVTSAQGAMLNILLEVTVLPLAPELIANPGSLSTGMLVGSQSLVTFTVTNDGGAPSGELQVGLPSTSYMTLASPATIPSLAPGASSTVTVELSPPADLPLEQYTGTIGIGNSQTGISVPFTFTAITNAVGNVYVLVDDNYTFEEPGSPRVQGATVNLLNPYDNTQVVATGVTDATGSVTLTNVPAGPYELQVEATGHSTYENAFTVVPGITNNDEVFIQEQFVSYTWVVAQTTIQDQYQIQLQTTFQTNVPVPVVTISAPASIPTLAPGQSGTFNVTVTNHGLIAAQGVTLDLPTDPEYTFTALSNSIGVLPADSSVVVPITVTRAAPQAVSNSVDGTTFTTEVEAPNPIGQSTASTLYVDYTNTGSVAIPAPLLELTATQNGTAGAFLSLDPSVAGLGYTSNNTPAAFGQTVQFLASGATPGMLEPGESVSVPVYYGGWLASEWSAGTPVTFSLTELDTTNTQSIDWSSLLPGLQPESINTAAWNVVGPVLANQMGSAWGQYVQTLDNDSAYLAGVGDPTTDVSQLLTFEIEKANAAYTAQTVASVTADAMPTPGMTLSFVQSFEQSISGRYTQGILGLGWTDNWDVSATNLTNGDVLIQAQSGSYYFTLQPNGSFAPTDGEEGMSLTVTDGACRLAQPDGTIYQFNESGALDFVQDTHGNRITCGYNGSNQLVSLTDSNGSYLDLFYNAQGDLSQLTDSNGQTETYGYDPTGQFLTTFTDVYGTTNYVYASGQSPAQDNALSEIAYADNTHLYFSYDAEGRLIDAHLDGGQEGEAWTYLSPGGYVVTDANGNAATTYFNLSGAAAVYIDPLGNVTRYSYDGNFNLTQVTGPGGITYSYTYDANGNLASQTDPLGLTTYFTYDSTNDLTSYTDPAGNTTSYAYDSQNDLLSITYANGIQQNYTYNPLGEATQYLDARGQAIGDTYNDQGLLTSETFADGTSYSYAYSPQGNLTSATDAKENVTTFVYADSDNPDLLTEVEYPDGTWLKFTYNIAGQRTQSVDQTGFTVNYIYDSAGLLSELTDGNGDLIVQYTYDNADNLIQKDMGNGTQTVYTYDGDGDVLNITNYASANGPVNSFDVYTYDALGNVLTDTNQDGEWVYAYDADSQMTGAVFTPNSTDPDGLTAQNIEYVYDAAGNRESETVNGVTTIYVVNNVNEYTNSTTNGVATSFEYDADGNLIAQTTGESATNYSFNALNELTSVNGPGVTANYAYDPLGDRVSQTVNGAMTNFQVDPALGSMVAAYDSMGDLLTHYTYGLGLVSQVTAQGTAGYYDFNLVGNTVGITNAGGSYVNQYSYLPFGQTATIAATLTNPFTFQGEFGNVSNEGGSLQTPFRTYDPSTGQFDSNDPLGLAGGSVNLRQYAANEPTTLVDPSGLCFVGLGVAVGEGFSAGVEVLVDQNGELYLKGSVGVSVGTPGSVSIELSRDKVGPGVDLTASVNGPVSGASVGTGGTSANIGPVTVSGGGDLGLEKDFSKESKTRVGLNVGASVMVSGTVDLHRKAPFGIRAPCPTPSKTPGKNAGNDTNGGPCTLGLAALSYYICGNNDVQSVFTGLIAVGGRDCSAQGVAASLASIQGSPGGEGGSGPGGGTGGPGGSGGGGEGPGIGSSVNCNPEINNIDQDLDQITGDISGPDTDTAPSIENTDVAANDIGEPGDTSPQTFMAEAFGSLGLIDEGAGGAEATVVGPPADPPELVGTIATFDQAEADLAGIFATAATAGGSVNIGGDINLLQQVDNELEAVTNAENAIFGGDADWLDTTQTATLQQWITAFFTDAQNGNGTITSAEEAQLLATTLPSTVTTAEATEFINRWNLSVQYWGEGIYTAAQVPAGQSTDFLDAGILQNIFNAAQTAEQESQVAGYTDPLAQLHVALTTVQNDLASQGVCASVVLQIDQTATLTRSAFTGTLSLTNGESGALSNVAMNIAITDSLGNPANGEFYISSPTYTGAFNVVNGSATLPAESTGTITFTFIPDNSAAASAPTMYFIGGTIGYTDPAGGNVSISVFPSTITVYPQAELQLNYFLQTDVIGPNPFSSQVIPSEPAVLGMLVTNVGGGAANQLSITTAQPEIIQNQKGLLVNIQIIGSQVGAQQESPSLTVNFGNLAPGQTADADFLLLSSLQGIFTNFTATFQHSDALGGMETSLIESVETHTLIYAGNFNYPDSTGEIDYLAEDNANPENLPDTIYFSDGTTAPVNIATDVQSSAGNAPLTYTVTANVASGWDYIQLPDPGAGYTLSEVIRSDGTVIPVNAQAWQTQWSFNAAGTATQDDELHILDFDSTGSYTVVYVPVSTTPPAITQLQPIRPNPTNQPVSSVQVTFSEPINFATFTASNLNLSLNGGPNLITSAVTITPVSGSTYQINGLSTLDTADGVYELTVSAAGVQDNYGNVGTGSLSESWTMSANAPFVSSLSGVTSGPRNAPVSSVQVTFSESINPASFTDSALTLTLNGGPNLIDSDVTISQVSGNTYEVDGLAGLTATDGSYVLTVNATAITDPNGNPGVGFDSVSWELNTVGPTISEITGVPAATNMPLGSVTVAFSEPIDPATFTLGALSLTLNGGSNLIDPDVTIQEVSGSTYTIGGLAGLTGAQGTYELTVSAGGVVDLGGNNGTGEDSVSWVVNTTPPAPASNIAVSPGSSLGNNSFITNALSPTISGTLGGEGETVDLFDETLGEDLGMATETGTTFSGTVNFANAGDQQVQVRVTDPAGNETDSTISLFIDVTPPVVNSIANAPSGPTTATVPSLDVTFSEAIDPATFTASALTLTLNGGSNLIDSGVTVSEISGTTYEVSGLSALTGDVGEYQFSIDLAAIQDLAGNSGVGTTSVSWQSIPHVGLDLPGQATAGVPVPLTVSILTPADVLDGSYAGTIHLTSSDIQAGLPADYPFTGSDAGQHTFSILFKTAGNQDVSAADTAADSVSGSADISVSPAAAAVYFLSGVPFNATAGTIVRFTVTAEDAFGNIATSYLGTVHFTSTDPQALLPQDYAFTSADEGVHTFNFLLETAGRQSVTATDTLTGSITGSASELVTPGPAAQFKLTAPASVPTGDSFTLTVTALDAFNNVVNLYSGTVHFTSSDPDAVLPADFTFSAGDAGVQSFTATLVALGVQTVTVTDTGNSSLSQSISVTVMQSPTSTSVTSSASSSVFGQLVTFSATVTPTGSGTPTGTVTFLDGAVTLGTATLSGGQATLSHTIRSLGVKDITVIYSGDANFIGGTSGVLSQTVDQDSTTSSVSSSAQTSSSGQSVTFTATVTANLPGSGTPTGNVAFLDGTATLGTVHLDSSGQAILTTSHLARGVDDITVIYRGTKQFETSTSAPLAQTVHGNGAASIVTSSSADPSVSGETVTFTATVSASGSTGTPTGTVTFLKDGVTLGTASLSDGQATLSHVIRSVGVQDITVLYSGDANFAGSTSGVLSQTVDQDSTTSSVSSSAPTSSSGQSVTFTATVTANLPGSGTPTGNVAFLDGTVTLGTVHLNGSGQATLTTSQLATGVDDITVIYRGAKQFETSTSAMLSQTVHGSGAVSIVTSSSADPSVSGETVTFTATVSASGSTGTPTGTVTFLKDGVTLGTASLSDGQATLSHVSRSVGVQDITVIYSGDANFAGSTSGVLSQTVDQDSTTSSVSSSALTSASGQSVTFTATVTANLPGSGTPTGNVVFLDGTLTLGTVHLSGGQATLTTSHLAVGVDDITVLYRGAKQFEASTSATLSQTVNGSGAMSIVTSSSAGASSSSAEAVTFVAAVGANPSGSGTPTGSVAFVDDGVTLGRGTLEGGTGPRGELAGLSQWVWSGALQRASRFRDDVSLLRKERPEMLLADTDWLEMSANVTCESADAMAGWLAIRSAGRDGEVGVDLLAVDRFFVEGLNSGWGGAELSASSATCAESAKCVRIKMPAIATRCPGGRSTPTPFGGRTGNEGRK